MTASEAPLNVPPRPGRLRRGWEWLWRGEALKLARFEQAKPSAIAMARARVAAEVGERILNPPTPWLAGSAAHLAAAAFVEALGWTLRGERGAPAAATDDQGSAALTAPARDELARLIQEHESLLLELAPGREKLDQLRLLALDRPFEAVSYTPADSEVAARVLAGVVARLLDRQRERLLPSDRVLLQRAQRTGALVLVALLALSLKPLDRIWLEPRRDLAAGKAWRASSTGENACVSPAQQCGANRDFFFHTNEEDEPWLEIDLASPQSFSALRVVNRQDCCSERAVPLIAEVSGDHRNWRPVGQQRETFDTWVPRFPSVTARWVRLRVARRSTLHLYEVRVLP